MRNENVKYVLNNPGERKEEGGEERPRMDAFFFFFKESYVRRILIKALRSRKCVTVLYIPTHQPKERKVSTFTGV